jgi:hypothetical protein
MGESERFTVKPLIISYIGIYGMHKHVSPGPRGYTFPALLLSR